MSKLLEFNIPSFSLDISPRTERKLYHLRSVIEYQINKFRDVEFEREEITAEETLKFVLGEFHEELRNLNLNKESAMASGVLKMYRTANQQKEESSKRHDFKRAQCQQAISVLMKQLGAIRKRAFELENSRKTGAVDDDCREDNIITLIVRCEGMIRETVSLAKQTGETLVELRIMDNLCDVSEQLQRFVHVSANSRGESTDSHDTAGGNVCGSRGEWLDQLQNYQSEIDEELEVPVDEDLIYPASERPNRFYLFEEFVSRKPSDPKLKVGQVRMEKIIGTSDDGQQYETLKIHRGSREDISLLNDSAFADDVDIELPLTNSSRPSPLPARNISAEDASSPRTRASSYYGLQDAESLSDHVMTERMPSYMYLTNAIRETDKVKRETPTPDLCPEAVTPMLRTHSRSLLDGKYAGLDRVTKLATLGFVSFIAFLLIFLLIRNHSCFSLTDSVNYKMDLLFDAWKPLLSLRHFAPPPL